MPSPEHKSGRGPTQAIDPFALVHPELRDGVAALRARDPAFPGGPDHSVTPQELAALIHPLRRAWAADTSHVPAIARTTPVTRHEVRRPDHPHAVPVHIVGGRSDRPRPAILHMHGGGFIVGSAAEYVPVLQAQARALDCVIVSVDYRLAPETPFPGSLEDNYAALKWLYENSEALGVDPQRIAVQGESAGGGHAAMLAIAARDRGEVPVMFQCLTYPMLDDRTGSSRAVPAHLGTCCWTAKYNRMGWSAFLGMPAGSRSVPAGAVPARVADLRGLPPTFIWVGSLDLFVQENLAYADRLSSAGVPVELHLAPGVYHGFDGVAPAACLTIAYKTALLASLARAFGIEMHRNARTFITPDRVNAAGPRR